MILGYLKRIETITKKSLGIDIKYFASGGFWLLVGSLFLGVISFLSLWLLANYLPQEDFGFYQFFIATLSIISIAALPGMRTSIVVSTAEKKDGTYPFLVKKRLLWSLLGSCAFFITGAYFYFFRGSLWEIFVIAGFFFPFLIGLNIYNDYFNGRKEFKRTSLYSIGSKLLTWVPIAILIFFITKNIFIIILTYLITQLAFHIYGHRKAKQSLRNNTLDKKAYKYGWLINLNYSINLLGNHLDKIVVTYFFGFITLASYAVLRQLFDLMMSFTGILKTLIFPKLSEMNSKEGKKAIKKNLWLVCILAVIGTSIAIVLINPLITFFFPKYLEIIPLTQLLFVAVGFNYISTVFISYFSSQRKAKVIIGETFTYNIIKIGGFIALIPFFGLLGGVISIFLADVWRLIYNASVFYFFES